MKQLLELLVQNPTYYAVQLFLVPEKSYTDSEGKTQKAPYYAKNPNASSSSTVEMNGLTLLDGGSIFIPGAPRPTGNPTPGWWVKAYDSKTGKFSTPDPSKLYDTVIRVVEAVSATEHRFVKNAIFTPDSFDFADFPFDTTRTWAEAQDFAVSSSSI